MTVLQLINTVRQKLHPETFIVLIAYIACDKNRIQVKECFIVKGLKKTRDLFFKWRAWYNVVNWECVLVG